MHLLVFVVRESMVECKMLAGDWSEERGFESVKSGGSDGRESSAEGFQRVS